MTELLPLQGTALLAGILGSAHCLGMCGGISGLYALHGRQTGTRDQLPMALTYNLGRLASYAMLGLIVATFGQALVAVTPAIAGPVRFLEPPPPETLPPPHSKPGHRLSRHPPHPPGATACPDLPLPQRPARIRRWAIRVARRLPRIRQRHW